MPLHRARVRLLLSLAFLLGTLLACGWSQAGVRFVHAGHAPAVHAVDAAAIDPQAPIQDDSGQAGCSLEDNSVDDVLALPGQFSLNLARYASQQPHSRFPALISGFAAQDLRPPIA